MNLTRPGLIFMEGVHMHAVNMYEVKTRLEASRPKVRFGLLKGKIKLSADFDALLPAEALAQFEGS